ncbi:MAG TPA: ankyrin repeat domain-containing protein [Bryobacteraceae bacterium]|nr:ankyrin repeat domain-containing protein [Bryobacteraceae bacterium]
MRVPVAVCFLACLVPVSSFADLGEDFLAAIRKSDAARVKALLEQGVDVNTKSPYGATGLFFAADRGNLEILKLLLDHGADVNVKDTFYGATALTWASMKEHVDVIRLLLDKGAKAGADDVLMTGVEKNNIEMVKAALDHKTSIPAEMLSSALAQSVKENHSEIADLLRKAGAVPPVKPNFQVDAETLKSYAGTYAREGMELKFQIVDGKLTGGPVGQKAAAYDAIDRVTFQHPEFPVKLVFASENSKVTSLTIHQPGGNTMEFKKTGAQ